VKDINDKIIPHFSKYPLISQKRADFLLWSKVVQMMTNKDHLNLSGAPFLTILTYYASINPPLLHFFLRKKERGEGRSQRYVEESFKALS
jgi:hypothetical protein